MVSTSLRGDFEKFLNSDEQEHIFETFYGHDLDDIVAFGNAVQYHLGTPGKYPLLSVLKNKNTWTITKVS
jgi:hypothetical protein